MQVEAIRGVCIGTDRHLTPGECGEVDASTAQFLVSIGAVKRVEDAPKVAEDESATVVPAKPGKKEKQHAE